MSGSQACRSSPHGPIEKEMCHLRQRNTCKLNHSGCLLSQILFHCFVCLCTCICIFFLHFLLPHFVLIMYVPIFSVDGHHLAFLYDRTYM